MLESSSRWTDNGQTRTAVDWVDLAAKAARGRDRHFVASPFAVEVARRERAEGAASRAAFLRSMLGALVERGRPCIATLNLPAPVKSLIEEDFRRIEHDLESAGDEQYTLARHGMRCDFRIAGFGRFPVGVGHIEEGGVPRRLLWSGGGAQAWRLASLFLRAGGRQPFYVSHFTHRLNPMAFLLVYNRDAQTAHHRMIAECLRMNPHIRGVLASAWWYDPALSRVAPHLAFLREGCLAHGAVLLRSGFTEGARKAALANSPRRQRLHAAGEYRPASYAVLWTRDALLEWAAAEPVVRASRP